MSRGQILVGFREDFVDVSVADAGAAAWVGGPAFQDARCLHFVSVLRTEMHVLQLCVRSVSARDGAEIHRGTVR